MKKAVLTFTITSLGLTMMAAPGSPNVTRNERFGRHGYGTMQVQSVPESSSTIGLALIGFAALAAAAAFCRKRTADANLSR